MACPHNWTQKYKGAGVVITICTLCDEVLSDAEFAIIVAKATAEAKVIGMDIDEPQQETWRDRPALL